MLVNLLKSVVFASRTVSKREKFMHLIRSPVGPQITITEGEKAQINAEIDKKMEELEETGLSREEILLSKSQKGIPLKIDPFFQFLKRNKRAREIYLKPEDRFTSAKVLDIALRQDIGPDPSYSRPRLNQKVQEKGRAQYLHDLEDKNSQAFNSSAYYAGKSSNLETMNEQLKPHQPYKHFYRPIDTYTRNQKRERKLKKYDIHWRNIELLRQFVTVNGNIKSKRINMISTVDQKRVEKAIKTARQMAAMPFYGRTPQPLKRNISSLEEEAQQLGYQHINLESGHVFQSRSSSLDSIEAEIQERSNVDYRYNKMLKEGETYQIWVSDREPTLDEQLLKSESYARTLKEKENQKNNKEKRIDDFQETMKKLTRINPSLQDNQYRIAASESKQCQEAFHRKKKEFTKKFEENPILFTEILFEEKTAL